MEDIKLQSITIRELPEYLNSEAYTNSEFVPISRHRALSHIANPRARPDDVVLVLVYFNNKMRAYLGVLPDLLHFNGQQIRGGWLSCMWVSPDLRGKGIAKKLINVVFEAWNYRILVTEFTPAAHGLYNKTQQFQDLKIIEGIRGYRRFNLKELILKKAPTRKKYSAIFSIIDTLGNAVNNLRLLVLKKEKTYTTEVSSIDDEIWKFIQPFKQNEFLNRNREELNWILQHPWVIDAKDTEDLKNRYHFSAIGSFRFKCLKIYIDSQKSELIGFLMLSIRGKNLKIPYAYFHSANTAIVAQTIAAEMAVQQMNMLTLFHKELVTYFTKNPKPFFKVRPFKRHYIISKSFGEEWKNQPVVIRDGDADCAFT